MEILLTHFVAGMLPCGFLGAMRQQMPAGVSLAESLETENGPSSVAWNWARGLFNLRSKSRRGLSLYLITGPI